jgi:hypothetical protein
MAIEAKSRLIASSLVIVMLGEILGILGCDISSLLYK